MPLHSFHGGLLVEDHKAASTEVPLARFRIARMLRVPLGQHIGTAAAPLVTVGEHVWKGQRIARSEDYIGAHIHAPTSGTVRAIEDHPVAHPSGLAAPCIVIESDGRDRWIEADHADYLIPLPDWRQRSAHELRTRIRAAGVVGLGGAVFPSAVKLNPRPGQAIETLIVNGAECEPYITADDTLMRSFPASILQGAQMAAHITGAKRIVVAVEDNKPRAITALTDALESLDPTERVTPVEIVSIPSVYPSGGERQLIKILSGLEVPSRGLPADIGFLVHNPGTLRAMREAILQGHPLVSRIVTLAGDGFQQPCNVEALIGTPVCELIEAAKGYRDGVDRLVLGGPMMGFTLCCDDVPVVKGMNCLLATSPEHRDPEPDVQPCIRCGDCERACPAQLLPQQLYWHARAQDFDQAQVHGLFDCIECGCCAYVCPSHIPLVQYYRHAKTEIWHLERARQKADIARERHEFRQQRLAREQREKAERLAKKKAMLAKKNDRGDQQDAIAAALARSQARKLQNHAASAAPASADTRATQAAPKGQNNVSNNNSGSVSNNISGTTDADAHAASDTSTAAPRSTTTDTAESAAHDLDAADRGRPNAAPPDSAESAAKPEANRLGATPTDRSNAHDEPDAIAPNPTAPHSDASDHKTSDHEASDHNTSGRQALDSQALDGKSARSEVAVVNGERDTSKSEATKTPRSASSSPATETR